MSNPTIQLDFQIALAAWRRIPRLRARLQAAAQATAEHVSCSSCFPASATILLTGNAKVRELNHDFRGADKATNVLSFPQLSPQEIRRFKKRKEILDLGDIALAHQYIAAEAKSEDKLLIDHVTHLVIHGLLHLLGYNHEREAPAKRMEKTEVEILSSLGLGDPYAQASKEI